LDFLGFIRQNRDFSRGLHGIQIKKSVAASGSVRSVSSAFNPVISPQPAACPSGRPGRSGYGKHGARSFGICQQNAFQLEAEARPVQRRESTLKRASVTPSQSRFTLSFSSQSHAEPPTDKAPSGASRPRAGILRALYSPPKRPGHSLCDAGHSREPGEAVGGDFLEQEFSRKESCNGWILPQPVWWNNMKQLETSVPPDEHERPDKSVPSDEPE
jgi:hypothetical protein